MCREPSCLIVATCQQPARCVDYGHPQFVEAFLARMRAEAARRAEGAGCGVWADPFAGQNSPACATNDLNPEAKAVSHMDGREWLQGQKTEFFDGVLYDPPYSFRQASEMYQGFGATHLVTRNDYWSECKDEIARMVKPGGKVICFGWNSMGIGKGRGFEMTRMLIVPHGGSKNDTLVTVETKRQAVLL